MRVEIRALVPDDVELVVGLSSAAWRPVFDSMKEILGATIFNHLFGDDWRRYQEFDVRRACEEHVASVATSDGTVLGFTAVDLPKDSTHGEIYMLAVHPAHQRHGIGTLLTQHGIDQIRDAGRKMAVVSTGGDPGHASARATYERAGFVGLPQRQYYLMV